MSTAIKHAYDGVELEEDFIVWVTNPYCHSISGTFKTLNEAIDHADYLQTARYGWKGSGDLIVGRGSRIEIVRNLRGSGVVFIGPESS